MSSIEYDPFANKSAVARVRWLIERNCEAMQRVASDPGFSSKHEAIRRRYTAFGRREEQLARMVGAEKANEIAYGIYSEVMSRVDEATDEC
jgi:hypothetical protein